MQKTKWSSMLAVCTISAVMHTAHASEKIAEAEGGINMRPAHVEQLMTNAFAADAMSTIDVLSTTDMEDTRGELWPFVLGVVGLDLAISTYFWGTYVPSMSGGGSCTACSLPLPLPR